MENELIFEFLINCFEKTTRKILVKLRLLQKEFSLIDCFCKKCGRRVLVDYNVSGEIWNQLPEKYHDKVLCFSCFIEEIKINDEIF